MTNDCLKHTYNVLYIKIIQKGGVQNGKRNNSEIKSSYIYWWILCFWRSGSAVVAYFRRKLLKHRIQLTKYSGCVGKESGSPDFYSNGNSVYQEKKSCVLVYPDVFHRIFMYQCKSGGTMESAAVYWKHDIFPVCDSGYYCKKKRISDTKVNDEVKQ